MPERDYAAEYRTRVAKAKATGFTSFWDQRRSRRPPEEAVLDALTQAGCPGPAEAARLAVEALRGEGWLR